MAKRRGSRPAPTNLLDAPMSIIDAELRKRARRGDAAASRELKERPRMPLRDYVAAAWPQIDGRPFKPNWHVDAKADVLEAVTDGQIRKLVINEPPGLAKSKVCSVAWPSWEWGPAGKPQMRWLVLSYGGGDEAPAVRDAQQMRQLINTEWYQAEWGPVFGWSDDQNAKDFYRNDKHGYRVSVGLDGAIPGHRADRTLVDDPSKPEDVYSDAIRQPADIYESTIRSRMVDDDSAIVLIMHRLHEDDLSGYFLKQDGWHVLSLPQFYEGNRSQVIVGGKVIAEDRRTYEGEPLHAGMTEAIAVARSQAVLRPDIYAGQHQQHPTQPEGAIVKAAWVRHWTPDTLPDSWDDDIIVVDCAFKNGEDNSWVVMEHWRRRMANAYLMDQARGHWDMPQTLVALLAFIVKVRTARGKWVEDKANGPAVVSMLKGRVPGLLSTSDDSEGPLCLKQFCSSSKEAKLHAVAPYIMAGNVLIPPIDARDSEGKQWVPGFIHEVTGFPRTTHDDQVDTLSMAVWKLLAQFEAHVPASELMRPTHADNTGLMAGVAATAYGPNAQAGFGGIDLAQMAREAFGR